MARFDLAIGSTLLWEGGYAHLQGDSGGETYRGISRNNWPNWGGWSLVDSHKASSGFPKSLDNDMPLQALVVAFYRQNFWIEDGVNNQQVANKVFDLSVNVGKFHAIKIAQIAAGVQADGAWGPNTLNAINSHPDGSLVPLIRIGAENYHKEIVQSHPEDAAFLAGWLRRDDA
jgi:lysozyme family protein